MKKTGEIMDFVWQEIQAHVPQDSHILDVACGTGIFARHLASTGRCKSVTGIDITPGMLSKALDAAKAEGKAIKFVQGDAADMRVFEDCAFDAVVTRLSIHHFAEPHVQLAEMVRVCKPGGVVVLCDIIAESDPVVAMEHNRLETLRDPSHTRMLPAAELATLVADSGLSVQSSSSAGVLQVPLLCPHGGTINVKLPFLDNGMRLHEWLESTRTVPSARATIERSLQIELNNGTKTGMLPFVLRTGAGAGAEEREEVCFSHRWAVCVGLKKKKPL